MTEIRSTIEARHIGAPTMQVIGQIPPPPPVKTQRLLSQTQKQNSLKKETELSPAKEAVQIPVLSRTVAPTTVINCPNSAAGDSVSSSPTGGPPSPKNQTFFTDKSWHLFQTQGGRLSWTQFEEQHHLLANEDDSERHSSDDEIDIWCITDEQKEYYINQFKSMQPDLNDKITGVVAKDFFEKSKLPVLELSKIWQLSDVDKDGALSLEEFCTAMHLVVLRRNKIDLPDVLPPPLIPRIPKKPEPSAHPPAPIPPPVPIPVVQPQVQPVSHNQIDHSPKQSPPPPVDLTSPQNKEWTKFTDSPTSSLSSPGMKPVNFDFSAASVEQNPKILHPVALRLSPERQNDSYPVDTEEPPVVTDDISKVNNTVQTQVLHKPKPRKPLGPSLSVASQSTHNTEAEFDNASSSCASNSFSGTSNAIRSGSLSQGSISLTQGPKKEPPPPPPPRPRHTQHTRSSSLDLNKLGSGVPHFLGAPPAVPPRISPCTSTPPKLGSHTDDLLMATDFADFSNFKEMDSSKLQPLFKPGAFEVYKKPFPSPSGLNANSNTGSETCLLDQACALTPTDGKTALLVDLDPNEDELVALHEKHDMSSALGPSTLASLTQDKQELQAALRAQRRQNTMLKRINHELNRELMEVMEERIALELQLENLKQSSS